MKTPEKCLIFSDVFIGQHQEAVHAERNHHRPVTALTRRKDEHKESKNNVEMVSKSNCDSKLLPECLLAKNMSMLTLAPPVIHHPSHLDHTVFKYLFKLIVSGAHRTFTLRSAVATLNCISYMARF